MKTKSKQRLKSAVSILLMLAVVITGAFAYFTATDSKKNVFTIGNVDIVLHEDDWTEPDENGDSQHIDGDNINVLPGDKITKAPYIENTGDNNAWVYMTIGIPTIQRDTSRPDDLAISFTNTNIPVEAYALQEGYGNVDGSQAMWDAYFADKSDDKFGTAVTDSSALLNRVELFNLPDIDSGWTQLGEVFKSEDGFNYYVFAYNDVIEPTSNTTPVIEWVQLNPALTQNDDVLFSPDDASVAYFVKNDIGESAAQEIYGAQADYEYAGAIELDYVPEQDDAYYVSNADALLTFNADSAQWEVESTKKNPVDEDLIPNSILSKNTAIIDPQADPDPNHIAPVKGDEWEDDDYIYKYGYYSFYNYDTDSVIWADGYYQNGWGVRVKDDTKSSYGPMKNKIWGEPVISAEATFYGCHNLLSVADLSQNLKYMHRAFMDCSSLIEPPDIPNSVTDMDSAFVSCDSLIKTPIFPSSVKDLTRTFANCYNLTQVELIPESVKDMSDTFDCCYSLVEAPEIPNSVTDMSGTFTSCKSLIKAPKIPNSVTDMSFTFEKCTSLINPPDMSEAIRVTDMNNAFDSCTALVYPPDLSNTINVEDLSQTFIRCESLTSAPEIPDSVTNMNGTFWYCSSLITPPDMSNATSVTKMSYTFDGCTSLVNPPDMSNVISVTDMSSTFNNCKSLISAPKIPATVTNMYRAFSGCTSLITPPDMSDAINVTDIRYAFTNCTSLVNPPNISNATGITSMYQTFYNCTSLISAPKIPKNVTTMYSAFYNCTSLITPPDMSDAISVTDMESTFMGCTSLTSAPKIPSSVTKMSNTFRDCKSLTGTVHIPAGVTSLFYCFNGTIEPITMEYYSSCSVAANYIVPYPCKITKVCIDA